MEFIKIMLNKCAYKCSKTSIFNQINNSECILENKWVNNLLNKEDFYLLLNLINNYRKLKKDNNYISYNKNI